MNKTITTAELYLNLAKIACEAAANKCPVSDGPSSLLASHIRVLPLLQAVAEEDIAKIKKEFKRLPMYSDFGKKYDKEDLKLSVTILNVKGEKIGEMP